MLLGEIDGGFHFGMVSNGKTVESTVVVLNGGEPRDPTKEELEMAKEQIIIMLDRYEEEFTI